MCRISIKLRLEAKLETVRLSDAIQLYLICIIEIDIEAGRTWRCDSYTGWHDIPGDNDTGRVSPLRISASRWRTRPRHPCWRSWGRTPACCPATGGRWAWPGCISDPWVWRSLSPPVKSKDSGCWLNFSKSFPTSWSCSFLPTTLNVLLMKWW